MNKKFLRSMIAALSLFMSCKKQPETSSGAVPKIRLGLLYTGDSFPLAQAAALGRFKDQGLDVEVFNFQSAAERDTALVTGQVDMINSDLIGSSLMFASHKDVQVVAGTLGHQVNSTRVAIVTMDPAVQVPSDLKNKTIGISRGSVIEYLADRMLASADIKPEEVVKTNVPKIAQRVQMVVEKQIAACVIPEPLVSMVVQQGGRVILNDQNQLISHAVIAARTEFVQRQSEALRKFLQVYDGMAQEINARPEQYRAALAERCRVPEEARSTFPLLNYAVAYKPSRELFADVQQWLKDTRLLEQAVVYEDIIKTSL